MPSHLSVSQKSTQMSSIELQITPEAVSTKGRLLVKVMLHVMLGRYLLTSGVPAVAQSENSNTFCQSLERCSNRTLLGDYGFAIEGTILDGNAPIRGVPCSTTMAGVISRRLIM
jgi:hypothetical protein